MVWICLSLIGVSLAVALPATRLMIRLGHRLRALDSAGVAGQVKAERRPVPNTGGVAIVAGVFVPLLFAVLAARVVPDATFERFAPAALPHLPGIRQETPLALLLAASLLLLHILGLIDDRRPQGPALKLIVMLVPAAAIATLGQTRLLTMLDGPVGGPWLSTILTVLWFLVVTNAMNFMDNMDGLSGGVAAIAAACFLAATLVQGQWFVAACLAALIGSLLGFLVFNFPPARIFMGDGGSLVVGFLLAFLTARVTYYAGPDLEAGAWYGVFMPLVVLAIPLYDFLSVVTVRLAQGRSPFVGDLQHFSHRLVKKGLSKRAAVLVIYGFTLCTGISGIALGSLRPWQAVLVGVQTLTLLGVLAVFEWRSTRERPSGGARP